MSYMEVPWKPCKFVPRFVNLDERVFLRGELRLQACSASGYAASNCYANVWVLAKWQRWILYTSTNVWCQQMLGIPCTLVVGTHIWCSQPQLLARLMLRCFDASIRCFDAHIFPTVVQTLPLLMEIWEICRNEHAGPFPGWRRTEVNDMTEKWCRCNVSRLNGLSALCLSQCSCLRTLLTSTKPANVQNADKEVTVYSFVKLAFISTNNHMRDVSIRRLEGVVCWRRLAWWWGVWSRR